MKQKIQTIAALVVFIVSTFCVVPSVPMNMINPIDTVVNQLEKTPVPNNIQPSIEKILADENPAYPSNLDLNDILGKRDNNYRTIYEPWKSKAAIHAIAYDEETGFLGLGGGYLYDNEVHLYRLNLETGEFDKVWEIGDGIITNDVLSIDFGDTDLNDFIEVVVGSSDGHIYLFEQRHLYDPYANTENMFDLVWTSDGFFKVFAVRIEDLDRDYHPDIIAGCWDGNVHMFEFNNHSQYPFVAEHWITFDEIATLDIGEKIYSLETGDTNNNGLPEIVVGTREGTVIVYENDGESLIINDQPFPLLRDNTYYLNWTSENYTWQPIRSIAIGELDGTPGDEIALVAEGQGVYTLDWDESRKTYNYRKVQREYAAWESYGFHGLDYWVDSVVYTHNVKYYDPINGSLVIDEPIEYQWNEVLEIFLPNASVYPYNTGMAQITDGNYSTFDTEQPGVENATAIIDFGLDEEGTGSANSDADLIIVFEEDLGPEIFTKFNFSIGQTTKDFLQISNESFTIMIADNKRLLIDVDDILTENKMDWFRYAKIDVFDGGNFSINSIELLQVYNLLTDALSVTIGPLRLDGDAFLSGNTEIDKIVAATVIGEFACIGYDFSEGGYSIEWESYDDERFSMGAYVWDIEHIMSVPGIPVWVDTGIQNNINPDFGAYNSWSYGVPSPLPLGGNGEPYYILGTDASVVRAVDVTGEVDMNMVGYLALINTGTRKYTSAEIVHLWPETTEGSNPMVVVGSYDPEGRYAEPDAWSSRANIEFYVRPTLFDQFDRWESVGAFDINREISQLLSMSKATPKMSFEDFDGDGDIDFVLSNGYVYMIRNLYYEMENYPCFGLEHGYFDSINAKSGGIVWGQPQLFDIDDDGDFDLILSYADRYGTTCFLNKGTNDNPIWEEDRRIFNNPGLDTAMTLRKLTDTRLVPNKGGYTLQKYVESGPTEIQGNFSLAAVKNETIPSLQWAAAFYNAIDTYLVATYPTVSRMEFCLLDSPSFKNIGFHIHESWNTESDLEDWTLSISSGDLDSDGRGEIIVGDYDNNVYSFEYLTNNTYKRMFRSFNLNHSVIATSSPYAYQRLEGLSGDFNRRIWDHARHLVPDVDLDQDGLRELLVASDLQVYIFEATGIDDTLEFAYTFDFRDLSYLDEEADAWEYVTEITAMDAGIDIDNDGRKDLVIAIGPFLFVMNIDQDSFDGLENNDYFGKAGDADGRYYLLGNPEAGTSDEFQNAYINTIVIGDTDVDSYPEVILGGIFDTSEGTPDGFAYIYECRGGTFYKAWQASSDIIEENPVSNIIIDDQDYDGNLEIIISHTKGFSIFEHIQDSDSQYLNTETVTSSPNYPVLNMSTALYSGLDTLTFTNRCANDITWGIGSLSDWIMMVYVNNQQLWLRRMNSSKMAVELPPAVSFISQTETGHISGNPYKDVTVVSEVQPSITSTDQDLWLAWKAKRNDGTFDFWVSKSLPSRYFADPVWIRNNTDQMGVLTLEDIFVFNSTHIAIMYSYEWHETTELYFHVISNDLSTHDGPYLLDYPNWSDFDVQSASICRMPDESFVIAMSAINTKTSKGDYDIWIVKGNSTFDFTMKATPATSSIYDELFPDIAYLLSDKNPIIIAYEVAGVPFEEQIGMVSSVDDGTKWSVQHKINTNPHYMSPMDFAGTKAYDIGGLPHYGPTAMSPSVIGLNSSGFFILQSFLVRDYGNHIVEDILFGYNPSSDWVWNSLHDVENIAVGDTDSDGRREVITSFEDVFTIYELEHSTDGMGYMNYSEVYYSTPFIYDITDLTVYDSNGNGWEEIGVSCHRGEVFILEYSDPSHGATKFTFAQANSTLTTHGWALGLGLASDDLDGDLRDEIIVVTAINRSIFCIDDNGSLLWNLTIGVSAPILEDLDGDSLPEILTSDENENVVAFNSLNGSILWNYTNATDDISSLTSGDIDQDMNPEVIFATDDGKVWILNNTGGYINDVTVDTGSLYSLILGDFTNDSTLGLAFINESYILKVINPINGTLLYETQPGMLHTWSNQPIRVHDLNGDGYDDLLFGKDTVHIVDITKSSIYYNTSIPGLVDEILIDDFDGDSIDEVYVQTRYDGVYLEEVSTNRIQWHYTQRIGKTRFSYPGKFGGTGALDIALSVETGYLILLDGKNGLPMWFNITGNWLDGLLAVDFNGDGHDSFVAFVFNMTSLTSDLIVFETIERQPLEAELELHSTYWEESLTINDLWVGDINNDNYDEILVAGGTGYNTLGVYQGRDKSLLWKHSPGGTIELARFGKLDSGLDIDFAILVNDSRIIIYDSETWTSLGSIDAPADYKIVDFYIDGFDMDPYDDIAVLFEKRSPNNYAYVAWYDSDGKWKYTGAQNSTDGGAHLAFGYFRGDLTPDVVFGGRERVARVLRGDGGQLVRSYNLLGTNIEGIAAGYFDSDSKEDFALLTSSRAYVVNATNHSIYNIDCGQDLRDGYAADLDGDGVQELVLNIRHDGVRAYNSTGIEVWTYEAPLVFLSYSPLSTCTFTDFDNDGTEDVVFTNAEYINVISGSIQQLLWHYVRSGSIYNPTIGVCVSYLGAPDIVAHDGTSLFVISGRINPPAPPMMLAAARGMSLSEIILQSAIIVGPMFIPIIISVIFIRKRRRRIEVTI